MSYIFTVCFLVLGLINHDSTLFLVAGLFSIAGSIDILGTRIPKFTASKITFVDKSKEENNGER